MKVFRAQKRLKACRRRDSDGKEKTAEFEARLSLYAAFCLDLEHSGQDVFASGRQDEDRARDISGGLQIPDYPLVPDSLCGKTSQVPRKVTWHVLSIHDPELAFWTSIIRCGNQYQV